MPTFGYIFMGSLKKKTNNKALRDSFKNAKQALKKPVSPY